MSKFSKVNNLYICQDNRGNTRWEASEVGIVIGSYRPNQADVLKIGPTATVYAYYLETSEKLKDIPLYDYYRFLTSDQWDPDLLTWVMERSGIAFYLEQFPRLDQLQEYLSYHRGKRDLQW